MMSYWKTVWILFGIFVVANAAYLGSMPGLLGDEASEGENVWEKLQLLSEGEPRTEYSVLMRGERSYIGPFIDYIRVPFVKTFGYTALALRLVMLAAALVTFWLAASVLRKLFDETPSLFALVFGFFNPIYLTQARLGWAITLFPFFAFLFLFFLTSQFKHRALLTGLSAGVGLSNHILFLPTLVAMIPLLFLPLTKGEIKEGVGQRWLSFWSALIGFWAGFAMQFAILVLNREDQGDVAAVAQTFWERAQDLPKLLPHVLSGSSYIASYTGVEMATMWQWIVSAVIIALVLVALFFGQRKKMAWLWFIGLVIQTIVLLYMIDRFSLRYFALPVIGRWMLAGAGLGTLISSLNRFWLHYDRRNFTSSSPAPRAKSPKSVGLETSAAVLVAIGLVIWSTFAILVPFLKTGGSTADFSLGNRVDTAAALVDVRPLVACLRGAGLVFSENIHIWNRLQFLSHQYSDLEVLSEDQKQSAKHMVEYQDARNPGAGDVCPDLAYFRVVAK